VTFIILGDLRGHERSPRPWSFRPGGLIGGRMSKLGRHAAEDVCGRTHGPREAVRSGSLAAMSSCSRPRTKAWSRPHDGFDPEGVRKAFRIPERYLRSCCFPWATRHRQLAGSRV